ncbi:hypothetical protein [Legionella norrlandica]|uniref:hypothetical protein n=1 Tax=Legionella norrlandica TaxID=1498499 RepID=UPI000ACF9EF0|nr:hypothetical protein [Legionella norrlandica]
MALKITQIDGEPVSTLASVFETLKPSFPSIKVGDEEASNLFEKYKLAEGMTDVCHLSLAYFGDFRVGRDTANELDQEKIDIAYEELHDKEFSFEINTCPFQVVSTSKEYKHITTSADLAYAPVVGMGRDTILNLLPSQSTQDAITKMLACAFGEGFKICNSRQEVVPFHITIAQTDKLNAVLAKANENSAEIEEVHSLIV